MSRIEIRPNRWINLPLLIADVVLVVVFVKVIFFGGFHGTESAPPLGLGFRLVFGFFTAIGVLMFCVLLYRLIVAPVTFVLDGEGMYLNPAGVTLGRFTWDEIAEIRVLDVIGTKSSRGGRRALPAVAVVLKNPDAYVKRFPKLISPLFRFRQAETGTPLLLEPAMFGTRYEEILSRMREEVARANASR